MTDVWQYLAAFVGMFFIDAVNAKYILSLQSDRPIVAANWSVIVYVSFSMIIIGYTTNPWLLLPAAVGGWLGTFVSVKYLKKKDS